MRFREIKQLIIKEQQLDELKMSPSALEQFAKSDAARGIQAGFEAELIFPGLGDSDGGDAEPDYDGYDERAYNIDDVINFFEYDDYGYGLSDRAANRLRQDLENEYLEYFDDALMSEWESDKFSQVKDYIERNDLFDQEEFIEDYLRDELGLSEEQIAEVVSAAKEATSSRNTPPEYRQASDAAAEQLDALTEQSIDNEDETYDRALDEFRDDFTGATEEDWLRETYRYMSDIENAFGLSWPYVRYVGGEGGYNEYQAERLADDLNSAIGMRVVASGGYHSTRRTTDTWIIEPDSSLEGDDSEDMPCEIVSPPMPLGQCLETMERFFDWAKSHDAYANSSTGFHMGVSLPITQGKVDFVKLALFLGDEYVLKSFGRSSNTYAEAAMKKIRNRIKTGSGRIDDAMNLMQHGLVELAERSIMGSTGDGFGKYTSINPKGAYIEFRSAGGVDYIKDVKKARNTLLRYAQAMSVAANPATERREYYKKLYKLISPSGGNSALDLFARFASGNISKEELKKQWAEAALSADAPEALSKSNWKVYTKLGQPVDGLEFDSMTEVEAMHAARTKMSPGSTMVGFKKSFDENFELRNVSASTGKWAIIDRATGDTLEVVDSEHRGDAADLAMEKYAGQGIDYYIEPVPTDTPKPKLSRRAELAKRIKGPKAEKNWIIVDKQTGRQGEPFAADSFEDALVKARHIVRSTGFSGDFGDTYSLWQRTPDGLKPAQPTGGPIPGSTLDRQRQRANQQTLAQGQGWELYKLSNDAGVMMLDFRDRAAAVEQARAWIQQQGGNVDHYGIRASTGVGQGPGPAANPTPAPVVGATMADQPLTVRAAHADTAAHNPAQQVTSDTGVPMWEIYVRETGQAVNRFPDHTQNTAWSTAQQWLRDAHAPESTWNGYSVRPLMQRGQ